jgi:predicted GNAT family acetyltransferase
MITHDEQTNRFTTGSDSAGAFLQYRRRADRFVILHTEVPGDEEGHGMGGALVAAAVEHAARHGFTVVPLCPFARSWLRRHPDAAERVSIDWPTDDAADSSAPSSHDHRLPTN